MDHPCDQYRGDPTLTKLFAYLDNRPEALDAVKTASFDPDVADALPSSAFAWEAERRYPMHTRADVVASIAYVSKYAGDRKIPAYVHERLADAAVAFNVTPAMFRSVATKTAAAPATYAFESQQRLPIDTVEQVKVASMVFDRDGAALPPPTRLEVATKIAAAAERLGVGVSAYVEASAGNTQCLRDTLRDRVGARAVTTKHAHVAAAYDALDLALAAQPEVLTDRSTLVALADRLWELDKVAEVTHLYGKKLHDPLMTVFNTPVKVAAATDPVAKLMSLPAAVWEQVGVPEMAETAQSGDTATFAQIYSTLPRDIKMVLEAQL